MPTAKQAPYIRDLMIDLGHAHGRYGSLRASAKHLPHGPSMRERGAGRGGVDAWIARLTMRQASTVIAALKAQLPPRETDQDLEKTPSNVEQKAP